MQVKKIKFLTIFKSLTFDDKIKLISENGDNLLNLLFDKVYLTAPNISKSIVQIDFTNQFIQIEVNKVKKILHYKIKNINMQDEEWEHKNEKVKNEIRDYPKYRIYEINTNTELDLNSIKHKKVLFFQDKELFQDTLGKDSNDHIRNNLFNKIVEQMNDKKIKVKSEIDKKTFISILMKPGFEISTLPQFLEYIYFHRPDLLRTFNFRESEFQQNLLNWFINYGFDELSFSLFFTKNNFLKKLESTPTKTENTFALIGYNNRVTGLSQNMQIFDKYFKKMNLRTMTFDVQNSQLIYSEGSNGAPIQSNFVDLNTFDRQIYFLNPNEYFSFIKQARLRIQNNFVYWAWELEKMPRLHVEDFREISGMWSVSKFSASSISKLFNREVQTIHIPMDGKGRIRKKTKERNRFFLFIFDYLSDFQRKNPLGIVQAFIKAFPKEQKEISLVIKTSNHKQRFAQHELLLRAINKRNDIKVITNNMSNDQIDALIQNCYAYVSLHRAEGFGLSMARAMIYGKPVIATGYSGNLDFMNEKNSLLLDYSLISTDNAVEKIYSSCNTDWADPKIDQAAFFMTKLIGDEKLALKIGQQASTDLTDILSFERFQKKITKLLDLTNYYVIKERKI